MPKVNWIPGVSQLKSVAQLVTGDVEGAVQTQADFLQECPGVSQVVSTVQLIADDVDGAIETQEKCLNTVDDVTNKTPVVGHAKGVVHYLVGDEEGGDEAFASATRTIVDVNNCLDDGIATAAEVTYEFVDNVICQNANNVQEAVLITFDN